MEVRNNLTKVNIHNTIYIAEQDNMLGPLNVN